MRILLAVCITALTAACSLTSGLGGGPLDVGSGQVRECLPEQGSSLFTFGWSALENHTPTPVTIESVSLVGARDFVMVSASLMPVGATHGGMVGASSRYPPLPFFTRGTSWAERVPAVHARISPEHESGLVVVLRRPDLAHEPSLRALRVGYRMGHTDYVKETNVSLVVRPTCGS